MPLFTVDSSKASLSEQMPLSAFDLFMVTWDNFDMSEL